MDIKILSQELLKESKNSKHEKLQRQEAPENIPGFFSTADLRSKSVIPT